MLSYRFMGALLSIPGSNMTSVPTEFEDIVMKVIEFIEPTASALAFQKPLPSKRSAPDPWL